MASSNHKKKGTYFEKLLGNDEVTVVPIEFLTQAHVEMTSGGEFLRRMEWLLDQHKKGNIVMAHTGRETEPKPDRTPVRLHKRDPLESHLGHILKHGPKQIGGKVQQKGLRDSSSENTTLGRGDTLLSRFYKEREAGSV